MHYTTSSMGPMLPIGTMRSTLEGPAIALVESCARMAAHIHPLVQKQVGWLVRTMNCYYSNLIEGHNTLPRDIEKALREEFSDNITQRNLQLEAKAHIEVQRNIDEDKMPYPAFTIKGICWIHEQFYQHMPEDLCWVENPDTGERIRVNPGEIRVRDVSIGRHIPPLGKDLHEFLLRFEEAYCLSRLNKLEQLIAIAAAHHRFLWIHPFYDGNGRVVRLISHAAFREVGVGNGLWSISRGLARSAAAYKANLAAADAPREGDPDGRGNLSQKHLIAFCDYFLATAIDQACYMGQLLDVNSLRDRIEAYTLKAIQEKRLPRNSNLLLKEILLRGEIERKYVAAITGYSERQARTIVAELMKQDLIASDTPYGPLQLRFPDKIVADYFPELYLPQLVS